MTILYLTIAVAILYLVIIQTVRSLLAETRRVEVPPYGYLIYAALLGIAVALIDLAKSTL